MILRKLYSIETVAFVLAVTILSIFVTNMVRVDKPCNIKSLKTQLEFTGTLTVEHITEVWTAEYRSKPETGLKDHIMSSGHTACQALNKIKDRLAELS